MERAVTGSENAGDAVVLETDLLKYNFILTSNCAYDLSSLLGNGCHPTEDRLRAVSSTDTLSAAENGWGRAVSNARTSPVLVDGSRNRAPFLVLAA